MSGALTRPSLWRVSAFRNLWLAQTVSLFGTGVTLLALPLLALFVLNASPLEIGLLYAAQYIPIVLLGLPAGVWVERLPLRQVMIVADLARAAALLTIPVTVLFGGLSMPVIYLVAVTVGVGTLFFDVAQLSYMPDILDEDRLVDANGKVELSRSAAQLAGPGLGGFLVQVLTAPIAILVDAVSYLVSAAFLSFTPGKRHRPRPAERLNLGRELSEGIRFVFAHPLIRPLLICGTLGELAYAAILALQVVFAAQELHLGATAIGVVIAAGPAGGVLGALLAERFARRFGMGTAFMVSIVVFSAGSVILPLAGDAVTFALGLFLGFLGAFVFNVLQLSLCQIVTPARLLGRMNSIFRFVSFGVIPLGAALGGALVEAVGLRGVYWIAAALNVVSIIAPLLSPIRRLPADYQTEYSGQNEQPEPAPEVVKEA